MSEVYFDKIFVLHPDVKKRDFLKANSLCAALNQEVITPGGLFDFMNEIRNGVRNALLIIASDLGVGKEFHENMMFNDGVVIDAGGDYFTSNQICFAFLEQCPIGSVIVCGNGELSESETRISRTSNERFSSTLRELLSQRRTSSTEVGA